MTRSATEQPDAAMDSSLAVPAGPAGPTGSTGPSVCHGDGHNEAAAATEHSSGSQLFPDGTATEHATSGNATE